MKDSLGKYGRVWVELPSANGRYEVLFASEGAASRAGMELCDRGFNESTRRGGCAKLTWRTQVTRESWLDFQTASRLQERRTQVDCDAGLHADLEAGGIVGRVAFVQLTRRPPDSSAPTWLASRSSLLAQ